VATGGTLGDVTVGYIEDYTRPHVFAAVKGAGPLVWEQRWESALRAERTERFDSDLIEILLLEASRPDRHDFRYSQLSSIAPKECAGEMRVRQIGSLALSLCYLAVGAADVLVGAVQTRSVDVAAGFLILEEAGGGVVALDDADIWQRPLDLQKRGGFVAWRRGLDSAQIMGKARQLRDSLLVRP
jgi:fructose-1,6-bisphosphatase/inositol monophosphatase family enzyme